MAMSAVDLIRAERYRQMQTFKYDSAHDDKHDVDYFIDRAASYVGREGDHHSVTVRDLVKAGALIAAAIDVLNRKEARERA